MYINTFSLQSKGDYMNYQKIYNDLIIRGKERVLSEYKESHHIIPRCLGGLDDNNNLVDLTPEEHYLAHLLLIKIYPNNPSLVYAAHMMIPYRPSNKMYGWLKRKYSIVVSDRQSGIGNSQYGTKWINNGINCLKIGSLDSIPDGYVIGRIKKIKIYQCEYCKNIFEQKTKEKFCTSKCKSYSISNNIKIIDDNLEDMISFFVVCKSMDKTLKQFGVVGVRAGSAYFSEHLKQRNLKIVNRRNS